MNIFKKIKLFLFIFFTSISNAAVTSLSCSAENLPEFNYYFVKLDTEKMIAERTMDYFPVNLALTSLGHQIDIQKKVKFSILSEPLEKNENFYQIWHELDASSRVAINRIKPENSLVWIDGMSFEFICSIVPEEIIDLKVKQLKGREKVKEQEYKF